MKRVVHWLAVVFKCLIIAVIFVEVFSFFIVITSNYSDLPPRSFCRFSMPAPGRR
jgi:hypothetical protein